jgi:ubiquinone/menaquinone biosynthesis C-methylase UbiE
MVRDLLHRVVARPWVYDCVQCLVGARTVRRRVAGQTQRIPSASRVLDVGGGTGAVNDWCQADVDYVCLDIDPVKIEGFLARNPRGRAILADATSIPLADASIDVVLCNSVTHHLDDRQLDAMVAEAARVLRPSGRLILTDAIWKRSRRVGRLFWHYDRGSHPRTAEVLRSTIGGHLRIDHWEHFAVWHEYVLCVAVPFNGAKVC